MSPHFQRSEVFSARELARAAGVPVARIRHLTALGHLRTVDGEFIAEDEAIRIVRWLKAGTAAGAATDGLPAPVVDRPLFASSTGARRYPGLPLAVSSTVHGLLILAAVFLSATGLGTAELDYLVLERDHESIQLVFLALPGPGGGGGGGGLRQPAPPPRAERAGQARLSSPLPAREPPPPAEPPPPRPEEPPPLAHEPLPPIIAPIATAPSDTRDRAGVLEETRSDEESRGPGDGGGAGTGHGTGLGEGEGPGVGPGYGGGTGGGPYRPGSGIEPPQLLREVKPVYTEEARQRRIEGDVLLEIVVRRDGSVGDVRVRRSLGAGLEQRAIEAVRQWRFSPARRLGSPVDVMVEVAVEFKLR
jgi:periplasmic protein TonB